MDFYCAQFLHCCLLELLHQFCEVDFIFPYEQMRRQRRRDDPHYLEMPMEIVTIETVTDSISLGSKITADGDCSHEIQRWLLLGRKAMTNLDSIVKSRDITLPTKFCLVKAMVFLVVMCGCESWTIKKAEH